MLKKKREALRKAIHQSYRDSLDPTKSSQKSLEKFFRISDPRGSVPNFDKMEEEICKRVKDTFGWDGSTLPKHTAIMSEIEKASNSTDIKGASREALWNSITELVGPKIVGSFRDKLNKKGEKLKSQFDGSNGKLPQQVAACVKALNFNDGKFMQLSTIKDVEGIWNADPDAALQKKLNAIENKFGDRLEPMVVFDSKGSKGIGNDGQQIKYVLENYSSTKLSMFYALMCQMVLKYSGNGERYWTPPGTNVIADFDKYKEAREHRVVSKAVDLMDNWLDFQAKASKPLWKPKDGYGELRRLLRVGEERRQISEDKVATRWAANPANKKKKFDQAAWRQRYTLPADIKQLQKAARSKCLYKLFEEVVGKHVVKGATIYRMKCSKCWMCEMGVYIYFLEIGGKMWRCNASCGEDEHVLTPGGIANMAGTISSDQFNFKGTLLELGMLPSNKDCNYWKRARPYLKFDILGNHSTQIFTINRDSVTDTAADIEAQIGDTTSTGQASIDPRFSTKMTRLAANTEGKLFNPPLFESKELLNVEPHLEKIIEELNQRYDTATLPIGTIKNHFRATCLITCLQMLLRLAENAADKSVQGGGEKKRGG